MAPCLGRVADWPTRSASADHVVDYTRTDFTANGEQYDVLADIVGKCNFFSALKSVKPGGWFILVNPDFSHLLLRMLWGPFSRRRIRFALAGYKLADLEYLKSLLAEGKVKPVIDRRYPLKAVVEAHRYVDGGKRVGNVVLTMVGFEPSGGI